MGNLHPWLACVVVACASAQRAPLAHDVETAAIVDGGARPAVQATTSMDAAEAWAWLRTELPSETANLRLDTDGRALASLLAWAAPGETITAFDGVCRPLKLTRDESTLGGDIHVRTTFRPTTKTVSGESIAFGRRVTITCGFDQTYERADGGWALTQQSATGCDHDVGHRLSDVADDAASYDAVDAEIVIHCAARHKRTQRCSDGTSRTCTSCDRLGFDVSSREGRFHSASPTLTAEGPAAAEVVDCTHPCAPDEREAKIAPANAALSHAKLELVRTEYPLLFRTAAACRAYAAHHPPAAVPW